MVCSFIKSHSCGGLYGALGMEAFGLSLEDHLPRQEAKGLHIPHIRTLLLQHWWIKWYSLCMGGWEEYGHFDGRI